MSGGTDAVVAKSQDLAAQAGRVLRDLADVAAGGHVDHAVASEDDAAVQTRVALVGLRHQEIADVGERAAFESAARERRRALAVLDGLGVGEVDQTVVGEPRMQRDVHEAAVAVGPHTRHAGNRRRIEYAVADDAEPAGPFGDQHAAVREKRDAPWMRQPSGHDADADLVLFGRIEHERSRTERRHGQADDGPWLNRLRLLRVAGDQCAGEDEWNQTSGASADHDDLPGFHVRRRSRSEIPVRLLEMPANLQFAMDTISGRKWLSRRARA